MPVNKTIALQHESASQKDSMQLLFACREWDAYVRSVELPAGIAKGISAEARRRPLTMTVNLGGTAMEVMTFPS